MGLGRASILVPAVVLFILLDGTLGNVIDTEQAPENNVTHPADSTSPLAVPFSTLSCVGTAEVAVCAYLIPPFERRAGPPSPSRTLGLAAYSLRRELGGCRRAAPGLGLEGGPMRECVVQRLRPCSATLQLGGPPLRRLQSARHVGRHALFLAYVKAQ